MALGVERGPDSGVGRNGPKDSTLDPIPPSWPGHAPHPKDQSRDLECRKGEVGAGQGTRSLRPIGSPPCPTISLWSQGLWAGWGKNPFCSMNWKINC